MRRLCSSYTEAVQGSCRGCRQSVGRCRRGVGRCVQDCRQLSADVCGTVGSYRQVCAGLSAASRQVSQTLRQVLGRAHRRFGSYTVDAHRLSEALCRGSAGAETGPIFPTAGSGVFQPVPVVPPPVLGSLGLGLRCVGQWLQDFEGYEIRFGLELNVTTFTTLIIGFFIQNKVAEAAAIFSKMVEAGIQPNVVTFGTLIKGLCIKGNNVAAIQLLRKMEQGHCKPNVVVYNTIIDSLFKDARTR
ncbi:putative pentatricopeptide repeat-containing protein At3g16710, mitochondrial [Rosa chinensis]|uniref:putative pentatricopeptide repeat-containing protein At3g16710, mitochondrial n=1 Tax=Rosa chinensis TaxID=74649 RepID=UPI000D0949CC|nr:putative pentatricopeptide repeat-containing protein At3g16710, mitochondrial [Rosa chinensis]